ncbi:unnamed protein product [Prorocentrum cordatum]|uniref:Subtilisin n=1 Tax=Prorocentrum cordatum TaxID=2364126 RepID=A0ABN9WZ81_9DINO|nr:unnamed protein product [Polarella glacialis]
MTTSCQLRKREVRLTMGPCTSGGPVFNTADFEGSARSGFATAHYVRPLVVRWFHAEVEGMPDSVKRPLEEFACDRGCAIGMNGTRWDEERMSCQGGMGGRQAPDKERANRLSLKLEGPAPLP